jgi:lipid II:glycine glycyltransferase (peptidoglycan interpeptide bridge formation enzyme)
VTGNLTQPQAREPWNIEISTSIDDPEWDAFLESTPLGQFQQSSLWARYKMFSGWRPQRLILRTDEGLVGGIQLLFKQTRFGKIGYASKGPVLPLEEPRLCDFLLRQLRFTSQKIRLRVILVQPPDRSQQPALSLERAGYVQEHLMGVIGATLLINLRQDWAAIEAAMRRQTRNEVRQAHRRGTRILQAGRKELPAFFALMAETCRRQRTAPNPASVAELSQLWDALDRREHVRLTLACVGDRLVAGGLFIRFGNRATIWKKGWSGADREYRCNQALIHEGLVWARESGATVFDFASVAPEIVQRRQENLPLHPTHITSRDFIHLGFGGSPAVLPGARIWFANSLMRGTYRVAMRSSLLTRLMCSFLRQSRLVWAGAGTIMLPPLSAALARHGLGLVAP